MYRAEKLQSSAVPHLSAPTVVLTQVKSGEIPMDKVPYMQRGGAWDNSDLVTKKGKESMKKKTEKVVFNNKVSKGVEKKAWSKTDKEYAAVRFFPMFFFWCCVRLSRTSSVVSDCSIAPNECVKSCAGYANHVGKRKLCGHEPAHAVRM